MILLDLFQRDVFANINSRLHFDQSEGQDRIAFRLDHFAVEAVDGDALYELSAELGMSFKDRHPVPEAREVMGTGHAGASAANNGNMLPIWLRGCRSAGRGVLQRCFQVA